MEQQILIPEQAKPKGKGGVVLVGVGLIGLGTLAFFGWRKWKSMEAADEPTQLTPEAPSNTPVKSTKSNYSPPPAGNENFPLKRGSKGERIKQIQQVLVKKGVLDAKDVIGQFGPKTEAGLKKAGLPTVIDEAAFNSITGATAKPETQTPSTQTTSPPLIPIKPSEYALRLLQAAKTKDYDEAIGLLHLMKSTSDYVAVSDIFKTYFLNGYRKTLVNGMLDSFTDPTQKEAIRDAFKAMGLKYKAGKFSLEGIPHYGVITKSPTRVLDTITGKGIEVSKNMILGIYTVRKGKYTEFKNNGRLFLVPTANIKFYA